MKAANWMAVLNEQSEWRSDNDTIKWFAAILGRAKVHISNSTLESFKNTLSRMRKLVYENHFGNELDTDWLNQELAQLRLVFDWPPEFSSLPLLRTKVNSTDDESLLESLRGALILQLAADLASGLASGEKGSCVQRCEGLYRDASATKLSTVPEISDKIESLFRQEIPVLVEKELEADTEIQRCADLFEASSRSKFCSDACRFSTFQIIKQLKEPNYLAEKQRRYRRKKN